MARKLRHVIGAFGNCKQGAGADPPQAWVIPTRQCFRTGQAIVAAGELRLIDNFDFTIVQRAQQIGLEPMFAQEDNPFPWMSEMIDLKKERNFFETRVIDYQTGGALSWD